MTLSITKRKIEESKMYFRRAGGNLQKTFARMDSGITPARNYDRLRVLHDFFRPGYEQYFDYDDYRYMQTGRNFRDLICPDSISFKRSHFEFGDKFGRVLFLRTYASFLTDDLISDLTEYARNLILSIDMIPVPTDEAVKEVGNLSHGETHFSYGVLPAFFDLPCTISEKMIFFKKTDEIFTLQIPTYRVRRKGSDAFGR